MARLTGKSIDLFAYEDVRQKLKVKGSVSRGLQDIPLDAIVGSVGRYTDFTRSFLPRRDSDQQRWARVKAQVTDMGGLPPIEVYISFETATTGYRSPGNWTHPLFRPTSPRCAPRCPYHLMTSLMT
jgi:hypothetical protein